MSVLANSNIISKSDAFILMPLRKNSSGTQR
jgi:hypothetical protein